jgi:hypothetical protein
MSYESANQLSLKSTNDVIVKGMTLETTQPMILGGGVKFDINRNVIS